MRYFTGIKASTINHLAPQLERIDYTIRIKKLTDNSRYKSCPQITWVFFGHQEMGF